MTNETFLQGLKYIKAYYINWEFNFMDQFAVNLWYDKFKNLEDNVFMSLVKRYCENKKYAPNSPTELLEYMNELMEKKEMQPDQAWNKIIELVREYGFYYHSKEIYDIISDNPALERTVKEFERELTNVSSSDTFIANQFKKAYSENLKATVKEKSSNLLISSSENKKMLN